MSTLISKYLKYCLIGLCLISLSSCYQYEEVEIKEIKSVKFVELSEKGLVVESEIKLYNPNNYNIKILKSNFDVYVKDLKVGTARIDNKLNIEKDSERYYNLIIKSDYKDINESAIPKLIALTALGSDKIPVKIDGYLVGKVFLIRKKIEIEKEELVPLKLF